MGFLEYGATRGLAYRNDYDADMQRAVQAKQLQRQARIDARSKAALLDYEPGSAADPYNSKMLDALVKKNATELGKIATENPNWDTDPMLRNQVLSLKREMLDNPWTKNSLSLQQHKKELDDFASKTPGALQMPEIQQMYKQYDYAAKNGSVDGQGTPFTFMNPLDTFDIDADLGNHAKNLGSRENWDQSQFGGMGATVTGVPNEAIVGQAKNIWETSPNRLKYQARWSQMDDATKSYYNNDPVEWLSNSLKSKTDFKIDPGKFPGMGRTGSGSGDGEKFQYSPFVDQIMKNPRGVVTYNRDIMELSPAYKDGDKYFISPAEPLRIRTTDPSGKEGWMQLDSYNNTPIQVSATQKFMNDPDGRTMIEYAARVPLKKELASKGLLKDDSFWFFNSPADFDKTDYAENDAANNAVHLELNGEMPGYSGDKPDEKTGFATVKFWYPAATTSSHAQAFDKAQRGQTDANKVTSARMTEEGLNKMLSGLEGKDVEGPDGKIYHVQNGTLIAK